MAIYVQLPKESLKRLIEVAKQERRRPQDQAAMLLEAALAKVKEEAGE